MLKRGLVGLATGLVMATMLPASALANEADYCWTAKVCVSDKAGTMTDKAADTLAFDWNVHIQRGRSSGSRECRPWSPR